MITKAGVPSDKVIVGVTSYGRQFKMTDPNCVGKDCTFVGPKSSATGGRCTKTPEYISNAEIKEIIQTNPGAKVISNDDNSKTLIYDGNWVSYMDEEDKARRADLYKLLNFGGVVDWAIDLIQFRNGEGLIDNIVDPIKGGGSCNTANGGMRRGYASCRKSAVDCQQDESWKAVTCDKPREGDYDTPPPAKWAHYKADAAWCAVVSEWLSKRDTKYKNRPDKSFSDIVAFFFDGPSLFHCEKLTQSSSDSGCVLPGECPPGKTGVGGRHILQSMHNIHEVGNS